MAKFHAGSTKDRTQGSRGPTLLANHFANVIWRHTEPQDGDIIFNNHFELNCGWLINQSTHYFSHQKLHTWDSFLPQTRFQNLSHSFTSGEIARDAHSIRAVSLLCTDGRS